MVVNILKQNYNKNREKIDLQKSSLRGSLGVNKGLLSRTSLQNRAVQLITCDSHAHLVSKAGSVIGGKSPSPVFKWTSR